MTDTDLLTPQEYARYRRCSLRTLDRERAEGRGRPYVRLGRRILYRRADIERHMVAHLRGAREVARWTPQFSPGRLRDVRTPGRRRRK